MTLREVCGLATEELARAFLTKPATIAQRIVRAKAKILKPVFPTKCRRRKRYRIAWTLCSA
jgi:predicted RNA polymerase sigma factor